MSNPKTGGPAFPHIDSGCGRFEEGMTLRDYFAAKAMQGILANGDISASAAREKLTVNDFRLSCAQSAYAMADAMLKAREA